MDMDVKIIVYSWWDDYDDIMDDKSFGGSLDLKWNICKYFLYNFCVGGNVNINECVCWYGM